MEFMELKKIKQKLDNYFGGDSGIELEDLETDLTSVGKVGNAYTIPYGLSKKEKLQSYCW
jgi:hypothetical protein